MTFASITGHEQQKNILRRALANERVAHAYLFEGAEGIGKKLMALAFARALLCLQGTGCGDCVACRKVDHNNHPDVHLIDSAEAAIKIDQIRELQQQLSLRPLEGQYKVCLIDGAEYLTAGAANALLKTLEEPQPNTVMILLSGRPDQLLPTIRSRCQRLPFRRLSLRQLSALLSQRLDFNETEISVLAALSDGSFKKALGQKQQLFLEKRRELIQALSALSPGSNIPTLSLAEELAEEKESLQDFLDIFQAFFRDLLLLKYGRPEEDLVNQDLLELLNREARRASVESVLTKLKAIDQARFHLQRNVNRQLTMEVMLLGIAAA